MFCSNCVCPFPELVYFNLDPANRSGEAFDVPTLSRKSMKTLNLIKTLLRNPASYKSFQGSLFYIWLIFSFYQKMNKGGNRG